MRSRFLHPAYDLGWVILEIAKPNIESGVDMANVLVVEDDLLITRLLRLTLESDGYNVIAVLDGEGAVQFALRETPHLVILDGGLTGADGRQVARRLREHPKTMHIPIIVLSEQSEVAVKVQAFEAGIDDYITKPFHDEELLARVRTQLRRVQQRFLSPLTGLPGGLQVEQAIKYSLSRPDPWSILYLDLDNFKAFNDVYGFLAGNDLIRLVGRICQQVVHEYGNTDDFVGHIGGDDFMVMTTPESACCCALQRRKPRTIPSRAPGTWLHQWSRSEGEVISVPSGLPIHW